MFVNVFQTSLVLSQETVGRSGAHLRAPARGPRGQRGWCSEQRAESQGQSAVLHWDQDQSEHEGINSVYFHIWWPRRLKTTSDELTHRFCALGCRSRDRRRSKPKPTTKSCWGDQWGNLDAESRQTHSPLPCQRSRSRGWFVGAEAPYPNLWPREVGDQTGGGCVLLWRAWNMTAWGDIWPACDLEPSNSPFVPQCLLYKIGHVLIK